MTTVEGLFQRYSCPTESKQLCDRLAPLLRNESPDPVKCTKRFYNILIGTFDDALSKPNGCETVCVLLNTLRYISNGSPATSNGFIKLISFGLLDKISLWCSSLCLSALKLKGQPGWQKAADDILFTVTVIMNHSNEVMQHMIPLLPTLLMHISNKNLPCSARIEAARGCNTLLEACSVEHRCTISAKPQIKKVTQEMGKMIAEAGDIELQVTMVECLFRLTSIKERSSLAQRWYKKSPALLKAFTALRDSEFEVVDEKIRVFLNILNTSLGKKRTVYSLPCKRALLGTFELHRPADPGVDHFWVDFNLSSESLAMFVEDPYSRGGNNPEDSMWEYVVIRKNSLKHWTVEGTAGDVCLKLELVDVVHSILPNLSDASHTVAITFGSSVDPAYPCELIFGPPKSYHQSGQNRAAAKKAITVATLDRQKQNLPEISPIELPPNTPACGGQVNSQGSSTPTDQDIPTATPATSTPKPRSIKMVTPAPSTSSRTPSSSSRGAVRPTLVFSSNGEPQSATRKASLAMNTIVLGGESRVVSRAKKMPTAKVVPAAQTAPDRCIEKRIDVQQVARERAKVTTNGVAPSKGQARKQATKRSTESADSLSGEKLQVERAKKTNEPNVTKIDDVQAQKPSKLSTKKAPTQKSSLAVKKTVPPAKTVTRSTTASPASSKKSMTKKRMYQIPDSSDLDDIPSPVLYYDLPTRKKQEVRTVGAARKQNAGRSSGRQAINSTSKSVLSDVTNQSSGGTQLSRGGQQRVFNLTSAPMKKGKNNRRKVGRNSTASSLNNSSWLEDVNAIPDSMPVPTVSASSSQKSTAAYSPSLDGELGSRPPPPTTSKQRKRVRVPTDRDSFAFDSDDELDVSWKLAGDAKKRKVAASKLPTKRQYKLQAAPEKSKPMLSGARTKKVTTSKKNAKELKNVREDVDGVAKKSRPPTGANLLGRKRVIDDVYDPDFTPEFNCPKPKIAAVTAAKMAPRKKKAPSRAAKITDKPAKETPSLPLVRKDAAARKLIMMEEGSTTQRKTIENAKEAKKMQLTARNGKKKQPACKVDLPSVHDELYCSPAIPRVSASKPDQAERAQSHSKPRSRDSSKPDLHSPKLDVYLDSRKLVCPPSPKKTRPKQRARRSSGYYSDIHSCPPSSPESSDHSSKAELQDEVRKNLQLTEDELEKSSSPSSCNSPPTDQPTQVPPSPTSLHSSQVEADLNITTNFEEICRQLISRSGKTGHQPTTTAAVEAEAKKLKQYTKRTKLSEKCVAVAKKRRREQRGCCENDDEGRNSPPPPAPIVKKAQQQRSKVQTNKKPPMKKVTVSRKKTVPERERMPAPVSSEEEESEAEETESSGSSSDEDSESNEDASVKDTGGNKLEKTTIAKKAAKEAVDVGSEMQAMICSFKADLSKVVQSKQAGTQQLASKATQGELYKLWAAHQKQRIDTSSLFQQQLCRELDALEKEVKATQGNEEKASNQLKLCFKAMTKSLHKQQNQMDRLRALHVTYHKQVEHLEQTQERQRVTAQKSLKKEMHSLQKRLLEDSQKQEVARIKKNLHTMLMQL